MTLRIIFIVCWLIFLISSLWGDSTEDINFDRLRRVIIQVEGVKSQGDVGPNGERGWERLTLAVWSQHSTLPFARASIDAVESRRVCLAHLRWIARYLENPTPYRVALAYNAGLGAVKRLSIIQTQASYASRASNLYYIERSIPDEQTSYEHQ